MATSLPASRLLAATAIALLALSCGDDDGPGLTPSSAPTNNIQSVTIEGAEAVVPGGTATYTAIMHMKDGSVRRAGALGTVEAKWFSSSTSLLRIDAGGVATAGTGWGLAVLSASVRPLGPNRVVTGTREILVQPLGTFRIAGRIVEADLQSQGVPDVRIEVRASEDATSQVLTAATANTSGYYNLFGAPAQGVLHVSRSGYQPIVERYQIDRHTTRNFAMEVIPGSRPPLGSIYTMVVEATQCGSFQPLPTSLRRRQYTATMEVSGPSVTVTLSGASFHASADGRGNHFSGVLTPVGANVRLTGFYDFYYYPSYPQSPDVAEILPDGSVLVTNGTASLTGTGDQLTGMLSGGMYQYRGTTFPSVVWLSGCQAPRVTLTRQ